MLEMRSFQSLAAIAATARAGSPARAAKVLGCAPSSVYRAIDRLEAETGTTLFRRSARGWRPTAAGSEVLRLADLIEAQAAETELSLLSHSRTATAVVRISASDSFAAFLAPQLSSLVRSHPKVSIDLVVDNGVVDLQRRQADIAVRPDFQPGNSYIGQRAGKLVHALYGSRAIFERLGLPQSTSDLARYGVCALSPELQHFTGSQWWRGVATRHGLTAAITANTETALAGMIGAGAGIGALPCHLGDRLDGVVRVPRIEVGEPVDIWLITRPALRKAPAVRALIRSLATLVRRSERVLSGRG